MTTTRTRAGTKPALKNTYSKSPRIFERIESVLTQHGVQKLEWMYDQDSHRGRKIGLTFSIPAEGRLLHFQVPIDIESTQRAMQERATTNLQYQRATWDAAYQTAWATALDFVAVNMAMVDVRAARSVQQIFLPYLLSQDKAHTLYEIMEGDRFLLPSESETLHDDK